MGMASSRRYGMQEITMVTTSNASDWSVSSVESQSPVKWYALGNVYTQPIMSAFNTPIIDFSSNTGSETVIVKSSKGLTRFHCIRSEVTVLDVTKNVILTHLSCNNNLLTTIDVSKSVNLVYLYISFNQLTGSVDVSKSVDLITFDSAANSLTTIYVNQNQLDILNEVIPNPTDWWWRKDTHTTYVLKQ
ncbi:leucine-rich repeat domain-containing protein [Tenacibaculum piscium]|uniref:leucine-rich repeat domain-containing protein n=1 Tax=Tenacibaculum piscium TaxID=1458515 RepID=UPI001F2AA308|nr:leucine-rich repeat domain-containing protein [Tenacibaculum piscium]